MVAIWSIVLFQLLFSHCYIIPNSMKKHLYLLLFLGISFFGFSQKGPKEVTPEITAKIKADIEAEIPAFTAKLKEETSSLKIVEFSIDTFRIEQLYARKIELDYSTIGLKEALVELTEGYDVLLNKYYNLLMTSLKPEDKETLKIAQKAWLVYRDAEKELIWTMREDKYSGGGTIQGLIGLNNYHDLVKKRVDDLYYYYLSVLMD